MPCPLVRTTVPALPFAVAVLVIVGPLASATHAQSGTFLLPPTPPRSVNTNAASDAGPDVHADLVYGGAGTWTCVHETADPTLTGGGDRDVVWSESHDDGVTWSTPLRVATAFATDAGVSALDVEPCVARTDSTRLVAWATTRGSTNGKCGIDYALATTGSATWSTPQPIVTSFASDAFDDRNPSARGAAHRIVVAWERESTGGERDIFYARTLDAGATWSALGNLVSTMSIDTRDDRHPYVATTGGTIYMVAYDSIDLAAGPSGDTDVYIGWSSSGAGYSGPILVNTDGTSDTGADTHPALAYHAPTDTWFCVWQTTNTFGGTTGGDVEIAWSRSTASISAWTPPALVNADFASDAADDVEPTVYVDSLDRVVVAWSRRASPTDTDLVVTATSDLGATWTPIAPLNTNAASDAGLDGRPVLATDGIGHSIALWESTDTLGGTVGSDGEILRTTFLTPDWPELSTSFCFGHVESGNASRCPCSNDAPVGSRLGCLNSAGTGANVEPVGAFTVAAGTRFLRVNGAPPGSVVLTFQGTATVAAGLGNAFGDGLQCVGGTVRRFPTAVAGATGVAVTTFSPATHAGVVAGDLRVYQGWYRDAATFCTASTFNLTSACAVVWVP